MSAISAGKLYVGKLAPNSAPIHGLMQHSPLQLRQKLIDTVDDKYNVKDMVAIVEVLGILERLPVTKDILESTRLGKTVNEFRKKVKNDYLAKRAKALVKKWRETVLLPEDFSQSSQQPPPQQIQPSRSQNGKANNVDTLLREQIAQAKREGHGRTTDEIVRELEEQSVQEKLEAAAKTVPSTPSSSSKKTKAVQEKHRKVPQQPEPTAPPLKKAPTAELKTNNEFVENYLKSQSELRHQMEQQYLDSLSRSEFQESNESIPESPRSGSKKSSKRAKFVDVSSSVSFSSTPNSPAVPATTSTTSSQQPPLTSPQSSFSSNNNKIFRKSKLTNNLKDDSNQLLSEERDEIEPYYNNYSASTNNNINLVSNNVSSGFLAEFNDQSNEYECEPRPSKYLKSSSVDRFRGSSSSSPVSTPAGPPQELFQEEESSRSPPSVSAKPVVSPPSTSSSTTSSSLKSTSRKKRSRHREGFDDSEPSSPNRYDLIGSAAAADDNKKTFLFDEESRMESDINSGFPPKQPPCSSQVDFSLFTVKEEDEEEELKSCQYDDDEEEESADRGTHRAIDVDMLLNEQVPNVNGNLDPSGQFHEWHETYSVSHVKDGEPLHILPYCIIDF